MQDSVKITPAGLHFLQFFPDNHNVLDKYISKKLCCYIDGSIISAFTTRRCKNEGKEFAMNSLSFSFGRWKIFFYNLPPVIRLPISWCSFRCSHCIQTEGEIGNFHHWERLKACMRSVVFIYCLIPIDSWIVFFFFPSYSSFIQQLN